MRQAVNCTVYFSQDAVVTEQQKKLILSWALTCTHGVQEFTCTPGKTAGWLTCSFGGDLSLVDYKCNLLCVKTGLPYVVVCTEKNKFLVGPSRAYVEPFDFSAYPLLNPS
jgi:hypothetical protein